MTWVRIIRYRLYYSKPLLLLLYFTELYTRDNDINNIVGTAI